MEGWINPGTVKERTRTEEERVQPSYRIAFIRESISVGELYVHYKTGWFIKYVFITRAVD